MDFDEVLTGFTLTTRWSLLESGTVKASLEVSRRQYEPGRRTS